jgi:heme A synthase
VLVLIALFTSRSWVEDTPHVENDDRRPNLFTLALLSIFVLYVQLILGAMFRHHGLSWWPHVLNAATVAVVLPWTSIRALSRYSSIDQVRKPAITMLGLMIAQLCLGFVAFLTRVAWGRDAVQPELPMVVSTVAHVAVGALLLAATVVMAVQVWRHVPMTVREQIPGRERKPVAA